MNNAKRQHFNTIVVGGGQAGLVTGYYLKQQGDDFIILDAGERVGDGWRNRWDSLELFTAAKYNALPGLKFPALDSHYPNKDEMADYLEMYARHFDLPVELGVYVERVYRENKTYIVEGNGQHYTGNNVIIATGAYPKPNIPAFAEKLDPSIQQLHSSEYKNRGQLKHGHVLVVGAASSGTQIALDIVPERRVWLAGRYTGYIPRFFLGIDVFNVLTHTLFNFKVNTWLGQRVKKKMKSKGMPVVDIREKEVIEAGVQRLPRVNDVQDGKPVLDDGRVIDADVVIWATGYCHNYEWIELPIFDKKGMPKHQRGIVESESGFYFVGLPFLWRGKSPLVVGVRDDAKYITDVMVKRSKADHGTVREQSYAQTIST